MARPREAVGCRTLICRKADSGQLNDLATIHLVVDKRWAVREDLSPLASAKGISTQLLALSSQRFNPGLSRPRTAASLGLRLW